jgi:hypothetical protein
MKSIVIIGDFGWFLSLYGSLFIYHVLKRVILKIAQAFRIRGFFSVAKELEFL